MRDDARQDPEGLDLAAALTAIGRHERAKHEIDVAIADFRELGADAELARAEAMLPRPGTTASVADTPLAVLSKRELKVLRLVAEGRTNHEIAQRLVLSEHTVNRHVANILRKLGLPTRAAAASLAGRHGVG